MTLARIIVLTGLLALAAPQRFERPRPPARPGPGSGPGFGPGSGPGFGPGFGPGSGPGFGPGFGPGYGPGNGYPSNVDVDGAQQLGAACDYDEDCYSLEHTYCRAQQTCECKRGFQPSAAADRCLATVGARCNTRFDCAGLGTAAECRQGVCDCGLDNVPAPDGSCLKGAQRLNEECELNLQCERLGEGAVCLNGKCQCAAGKHEHNDKCYPNRVLHEPCNEAAECYIGKEYQSIVTCYLGNCRCREHYVESWEGKCTSSAKKVSTASATIVVALLVTITWRW